MTNTTKSNPVNNTIPIINNFHDSNVVNTNGDIHFSQYETHDLEEDMTTDEENTAFPRTDDDEASMTNDEDHLTQDGTDLIDLPGYETKKFSKRDDTPSTEEENLMSEKEQARNDSTHALQGNANDNTTYFLDPKTGNSHENVDNDVADLLDPKTGNTHIHKMNNSNVRIVYGQKKIHQTSIWKKFKLHPRSNSMVASPHSKTLTVTPLENIKRNLFTPASELLKHSVTVGSHDQEPTSITDTNNTFKPHEDATITRIRQEPRPETTEGQETLPSTFIINPYTKGKKNYKDNAKTLNSGLDTTDTTVTTKDINKPLGRFIHLAANERGYCNKTLSDYGESPQHDIENDKKPTTVLNPKVWTFNKPNQQRNNITLPPELEYLKEVILSQHSALEKSIKDLGKICLNFTNIIEQKKEIDIKLSDPDRVPRSLRFHTELMTSPRFQEHPEFIRLKKNLKTTMDRFTAESILIFQEWSKIHIQLLITDRCHGILQQAIHILKGLYSYWLNIIKYVPWPEQARKFPTLLLCKLYFQTEYSSNIDDIREYFELPSESILLQAAKIITQNNDDHLNQAILDGMDLDFLENSTPEQFRLISETLTSFHSILYACTIELWDFTSQKSRISEASAKLKAQMETDRISSATTATAQAINNAVASIQADNNSDQNTQLRIMNLEKIIKQHEETIKHLSKQTTKQKNSKGSHPGPMTSPDQSTYNHPMNIVDLTMALSQSPPQHTTSGQNSKKRKQIQWDNNMNQIKQYNPSTTPNQMWKNIQWDSNLSQVKQYHPFTTPTQMFASVTPSQTFAPSSTLNPQLYMNQPVPSLNQQSSQPQTTANLSQLPPPIFPTAPNPFSLPTHTPRHRRYRGGRSRGGRRGMPRGN